MPCYHPITGFRSRHVSANGKRKIEFNRSRGYIDQPVILPCGNCIGCRIDKSRQWAIRCVHESKLHARNCFLTLTYKDDQLPEYGTLCKLHLQKFFRALRDDGKVFRYYAVGEYAPETRRPHYHAIIFGLDFNEDGLRKNLKYNSQGNMLFVSDYLSKKWPYGHATIGSFSYQTAAYTARYVMKKQTGERAAETYTFTNTFTGEIHDLQPEFAIMSRKPGIGSGWYDKYSSDAFPSDFLIHEGKKHSVPRFYTDKLALSDPELYKTVKFKRKKSQSNNPDNTYDRLAVREECKEAQLKQLKRGNP